MPPLPYTVLQDLQYDYDPVGNVTRIHDVKNSEVMSSTYEILDRLTAVWRTMIAI